MQKTPFYVVKDALLHGKRCPFAMQNMPFYKSICNYLIVTVLQSRKKIISICFGLLHVLKSVSLLYCLQ